MKESVLFIRNMVCDRCILVVRQQLDELGLAYHNIQLGEVSLNATPSAEKKHELKKNLENLGFELLDDKKSGLVEKIKACIIRQVQQPLPDEPQQKFSVLLEEKLAVDYPALSHLFSSTEGITIEKYLILQRIEKAKELLVYGEMTLGEIAERLGYSSVQHLSQQFKKTTGLTPSAFRLLKDNRRIALDKV